MKTGSRSLEEVAREFQRIRSQKQGRPRYPKELWQEVFVLADEHSINEIASALGISHQYLRKRLNTRSKIAIGFAQVHPLLNKNHSTVELTIRRVEHPITLRWTGLIKDLPVLIAKLFRGDLP